LAISYEKRGLHPVCYCEKLPEKVEIFRKLYGALGFLGLFLGIKGKQLIGDSGQLLKVV